MMAAKSRGTGVLGTTLLLSVLSGMGTLVGIAAQIAIVRELGVGASSDIYFVGLSAPLLAMGVISGAVSYRIIPTLVKAKVAGLEYEAICASLLSKGVRFAAAVLPCGMLLSVLLAELQRSEEVPVGLDALAVSGLGWLCASLTAITAVMNAVLHSEGRFALPAAVSHIPQFCTLMLCLVADASAWHLAVALALGQTIVLIWTWRRCARWFIYKSAVGAVVFGNITGWLWVLASMLVFVSFGTVDSIVASDLGAGAVSSLGYGQRMVVNVAGVVVNSIGVIVLPVFARLAAQQNWDELSSQLGRTIRVVVVVLCCPAAVIAGFRDELISLLLFKTNLPAGETDRLAAAIGSLIWGVVPMACATILFRALYAQTLVRTAGLISLAGVVSYAAGSFLAVQIGAGLAGVGVAYAVMWVALVAWGSKMVGAGFEWLAAGKRAGRMACQVGPALAGVFGSIELMKHLFRHSGDNPIGDLVTLVVGGGLAVGVYAAILALLRNSEMTELLAIARSRLRPRAA
jgi:putative peptidoglycan lipid II flippase